MACKIKILKAEHGDCILIKCVFENSARNILIDGGPAKTYKSGNRKGELYKELEIIRDENQKIDLLIVTHVDDDHIGGILKGFENNGMLSELTEKIWFNSGSLIDHEFKQPADESHFIELNDSASLGKAYTSIKQGIRFEDYIDDKEIWHKNS